MQFRNFQVRSSEQSDIRQIHINPFAVSCFYADPHSGSSVTIELHSGSKFDCVTSLEDVADWLQSQ